jgi:hypothetical protein
VCDSDFVVGQSKTSLNAINAVIVNGGSSSLVPRGNISTRIGSAPFSRAASQNDLATLRRSSFSESVRIVTTSPGLTPKHSSTTFLATAASGDGIGSISGKGVISERQTN